VKSVNARYDGHADWYDETFSAYSNSADQLRFARRRLAAAVRDLAVVAERA
jgi:hypothetical protein